MRPRSRLLLGVPALLLALAGCAQRGALQERFDPQRSSPAQRARIDGLRAALGRVVASQPGAEAQLLLAMDELYRPLGPGERALLDAIRSEPGGDPELALPVGVAWVRVEGQVARGAGGERAIPLQLLPEPVWRAWSELDRALRRDLGRGLLIGSGYRSPAYQLYLVVEYLPRFEYSLAQTLAHVSLPGASDHNRVERQGLDFVSESGVDLEYSRPAAFAALPEYRWLRENAARFGFEPEPARDGEPVASPWHWRYAGGP